jgi:hypothetical protein
VIDDYDKVVRRQGGLPDQPFELLAAAEESTTSNLDRPVSRGAVGSTLGGQRIALLGEETRTQTLDGQGNRGTSSEEAVGPTLGGQRIALPGEETRNQQVTNHGSPTEQLPSTQRANGARSLDM